MPSFRFPTYFLSHGGGPWPWLKREMPFYEELERSLVQVRADLPTTPKAVLVISGHWEEDDFTVTASPQPPMVYDYGGFPDFTYRIKYPAPGDPGLASEVQQLLEDAGLNSKIDYERGFDHGTYTILYPMFPNADVPVIQLSLRRDYDPEAHLRAGRALAVLRDKGVMIIGSGFSFHNLRELQASSTVFEPARAFDEWLYNTMKAPAVERTQLLKNWLSGAPNPRLAHPVEEHFIPIMAAVGAAEGEEATRVYHEMFMGRFQCSSFRIG